MIHTIQIDDSTITGKSLLKKVLRNKSAVAIVKKQKQVKNILQLEPLTDISIQANPNNFKSFDEFKHSLDFELEKRFSKM